MGTMQREKEVGSKKCCSWMEFSCIVKKRENIFDFGASQVPDDWSKLSSVSVCRSVAQSVRSLVSQSLSPTVPLSLSRSVVCPLALTLSLGARPKATYMFADKQMHTSGAGVAPGDTHIHSIWGQTTLESKANRKFCCSPKEERRMEGQTSTMFDIFALTVPSAHFSQLELLHFLQPFPPFWVLTCLLPILFAFFLHCKCRFGPFVPITRLLILKWALK